MGENLNRIFFVFLCIYCELVGANIPHLFSVAGGIYDFSRCKHSTAEFEMEMKFHWQWLKSPNRYLEFRPLIGLMGTLQGSIYGYIGINFDLLFWDHVLIAPGFSAGYYSKGQGKDLGYPIEFRSGLEFGWQFDDWHRLGVHFYHLSNASLGRKNPGEESIVLYYDIPIGDNFPYHR